MPVNNFTMQPAAWSLHAAYRPVLLKVEATATNGTPQPPFVACDIYINDKYYKTMLRTAPEEIGANTTLFSFDIADALQEFLQPDIAEVDNKQILLAPHMSAKVFCRFRASGKDAEGFTVEEGLIPVQGTKFTEPVSGDGFASNAFYVINSTLQHEDNQDLSAHLNVFKHGTWADNAFPLTHRNRYFFCNNSSDHYPLIYTGPCLDVDIVLNYRLKGSNNFLQAFANDSGPCPVMDYDLKVFGNNVDISLATALQPGAKVFVRIKLVASAVWTDIGYFSVDYFSITVPGAGNYDIQVVHFCTDCLNSDPVSDEFVIDQNATLGWRGLNAYCVTNAVNQVVYIELEIKNFNVDEVFYPGNVNPVYHQIQHRGDLYVKFFSDAAHLNPLIINGPITIHVKLGIYQSVVHSNGNQSNLDQEQVMSFNIAPNGVEAMLIGNTLIYSLEENILNNVVTVSKESLYGFSPFPSHLVTGGQTGFKGWEMLEQYNIQTGNPTGLTKLNNSADPDYIPPQQDVFTCVPGIPVTLIIYDAQLEIAKIEIAVHLPPTLFMFVPTTPNTGAGGHQYVLLIPKDKQVNISVKAKTLDPNNNSGVIKTRVMLDNGNQQEFNVPNNIETALPGNFISINRIIISNY